MVILFLSNHNNLNLQIILIFFCFLGLRCCFLCISNFNLLFLFLVMVMIVLLNLLNSWLGLFSYDLLHLLVWHIRKRLKMICLFHQLLAHFVEGISFNWGSIGDFWLGFTHFLSIWWAGCLSNRSWNLFNLIIDRLNIISLL